MADRRIRKRSGPKTLRRSVITPQLFMNLRRSAAEKHFPIPTCDRPRLRTRHLAPTLHEPTAVGEEFLLPLCRTKQNAPDSSESWDASLNSPPPKSAHNYPNLSFDSREWL